VLPTWRRAAWEDRVTRTYRLAASASRRWQRCWESGCSAPRTRSWPRTRGRRGGRAHLRPRRRGALAGAARRGSRGPRAGRRRHVRVGPRRRHVAGVLGRELAARGWTAALVEAGTGGATMRLLGDARGWCRRASSRQPRPTPDRRPGRAGPEFCRRDRRPGGAGGRVGRGHRVDVAVSGPWGAREAGQTAFLAAQRAVAGRGRGGRVPPCRGSDERPPARIGPLGLRRKAASGGQYAPGSSPARSWSGA